MPLITSQVQSYVRAYAHALSTGRAFVGDVRAGRCGLGGVSAERLLSCFVRPPPLTALCGPPAAVAAAAASAPAVFSSSIPLDLGFALRSPSLNEMTDAWLVSKLSTALLRPTRHAASYACAQLRMLGWPTRPGQGLVGCALPRAVLGVAIRLSVHTGSLPVGWAAAIIRLLAYTGATRVLLVPTMTLASAPLPVHTATLPAAAHEGASAVPSAGPSAEHTATQLSRVCARAKQALLAALMRHSPRALGGARGDGMFSANSTRAAARAFAPLMLRLSQRQKSGGAHVVRDEPPVACLPPNPYKPRPSATGQGVNIHSATGQGAAASAGPGSTSSDTSSGTSSGSDGKDDGALDAPGAAAATADWSAPLYYLSAVWHLSQADAFAGSLANDFGRTVHELLHARLTAEDESALPRVFELDAPASAAGGSGSAVVGASMALWTPSMPLPNLEDSEAGNADTASRAHGRSRELAGAQGGRTPVGHDADDKRSQTKAHSANARAERQHQQRSTQRDQVLRVDKGGSSKSAKAAAKAALVRLRQ